MILPLTIAGFSLFFIYCEFFLPGAILGMIGGVGLASSIALFYLKSESFFQTILFILTIGVFVILMIKMALWRLKTTAAFFPKQTQSGYVASTFDERLIGKIGQAASECKPSGYVLVEGERYPAVSESGYIKKGESIRITKGIGGHFIVKTIETKIKPH